MIDVTLINGQIMSLNDDLIETVQETPDTVISLTTGRKVIVKESRQQIKELVTRARREIHIP
ncbi:MAG: flagellar FlbD family protein [Eubacterium sp.]|nr:flagellar FlbD family protein [Eubacterium sp.]